MLHAEDAGGIPWPDFTNPGAVLGWMVCIAFLAFCLKGGGALSKLGLRSGGTPAEEVKTVDVPQPDGDTITHEVRDTDPGMWHAVQDMAATQLTTQRTLMEQSKQIAELRRDREELRNETARLRADIDALDEHVDTMIAGYERGQYPPWPNKPQRTGSYRV